MDPVRGDEPEPGGARPVHRPGPLELDDGSLAASLDELIRRFDGLRDHPARSAVAVAVAIGVAAFGWWLGRPGSAAPVEDRIPFASIDGAATSVSAPTSIAGSSTTGTTALVVHVAGAVRRPGLVTMRPGDRIGDAVEAAGGATELADLHQLNLAAPLLDGLQIRVPVAGETVSPVGVPAPAGEGASSETDSVVGLNTASAADLEQLPGIGPSLAAAIVEWRSTNGPFLAIDDLLAVPGIGPAKLAGLRDRVTL